MNIAPANKGNISTGWYINILLEYICKWFIFVLVFMSEIGCGFLFLISQSYASIIKLFGKLLCSLEHFIWHKYLSLGFIRLFSVIRLVWLSSEGISLTAFYCFCGCSSVQFYFSSLSIVFFLQWSNLCLWVFKIY